MLRILWADMDNGGFCAALVRPVLRFNGKLFKGSGDDGYSLLLSTQQVDWLIEAAGTNWREVEPAIFGTLLERALDPDERHALGAHYTPRAYVERLVLPAVIEALRAEWADALAAALLLAREAGDLEAHPPPVKVKKDFAALDRHSAAVRAKWTAARQQVKDFLHRLCTLRVLDPACGSANFLYVTLEHLKRLEDEVLNQLDAFGETQDSLDLGRETVTLLQLRGVEINERPAALAELVLLIGFLQWHIRTSGRSSVAEPVIHDYANIECRDAMLAFDRQQPMTDGDGQLVTSWDGESTKPHPVTRQRVPDEAGQIVQWRYLKPRKSIWPRVDFIVGNPPFIGNKRMRAARGARRRLCRRFAQRLARGARECRLRHVLVAPGGRDRQDRTCRALRPHHHQQPDDDFQPPGHRSAAARQPAAEPGFCHPGPPLGRQRRRRRRARRDVGRHCWQGRRKALHGRGRDRNCGWRTGCGVGQQGWRHSF
jgi:hypothetical protein